MKTKVHGIQSTDKGDPAAVVSFEEWSNINSGQLRALVFAGTVVFKKGDRILIGCDDQQQTWCVVKSIFDVEYAFPVYVVSIQPEKHRQREIERRKSYRALNRAHCLLRTQKGIGK